MKTIQPCSKKIKLHGLDYLEIQIDLAPTSQNIPLEQLFSVGVRRNKKRLFLFVSKVLGKHLAVKPQMVRLGGVLLAEVYYQQQTGKSLQQERLIQLFQEKELEEKACDAAFEVTYPLSEKTLFIGFAETATGLGHSMFRGFDEKATFIHTTREQVVSQTPSFCFEEEHSHATAHRCYTENPDFFKALNQIVLVDDEITTGNTALNLIEALHEKSGATKYSVVALLDWRNEAQQQQAKV